MNNLEKIPVESITISDSHVNLVTSLGNVHSISVAGGYDVTAFVTDFVAEKLANPASPVHIDMAQYYTLNSVLNDPDGIITVMTVDGQAIEGVFTPAAQNIQIKHGEDTMTLTEPDKLANQISRASQTKSPSVVNFLKLMAPVLANRRHSADDLMTFIEGCELPLTDSGHIIAYKRVRSTPLPGQYVDTHTGEVTQRVGSRVSMPGHLVDPDRDAACSAGLHVANLDYLRGFTGDSILIVKVDPSNFIAVPHVDVSKARVCSYDVVGVVDQDTFCSLSQSDPAETEAFEELISNIIRGDHPNITEHVMLDEDETGKLTIKLAVLKAEPKVSPDSNPSGKSLRSRKPLADETDNAKSVTRNGKMQAECRKIYDAWEKNPSRENLQTLLNYKRDKKKGLKALGLTDLERAKVKIPLKRIS